tara:strand:+ start:412 stop:1128 length:717 start_codon:yes stop_codon:yes gene_type:complete
MKIQKTRYSFEILIKESSERAQKKQKEYLLYDDIMVLIVNTMPEDIDIKYCLKKIRETIPFHFVYGLDSIFVGHFPEFDEKQINAFYKDGAIYVTNNQVNDDDFIDDIVHEMAHLVEKTYGAEIYGDQKVVREFLGKRQKLFYLLKGEGLKVDPKYFMHPDYSYEFDMFLFKNVGYPLLTQLTVGLFVSPYGVTSLAEYFAESFEFYFLKDRDLVKNTTPECFKKIKELETSEEFRGL